MIRKVDRGRGLEGMAVGDRGKLIGEAERVC